MLDIDFSDFIEIKANDETKHQPSIFLFDIEPKYYHKENEFCKQSKLKDTIKAQESNISSYVL